MFIPVFIPTWLLTDRLVCSLLDPRVRPGLACCLIGPDLTTSDSIWLGRRLWLLHTCMVRRAMWSYGLGRLGFVVVTTSSPCSPSLVMSAWSVVACPLYSCRPGASCCFIPGLVDLVVVMVPCRLRHCLTSLYGVINLCGRCNLAIGLCFRPGCPDRLVSPGIEAHAALSCPRLA